jgi:branched-chain amino acid aminotransferase
MAASASSMARPSAEARMAQAISETWTYIDGDWHSGNPPIIGPRTHAAWLGSAVFDGARAFEGVTPDLRAHCARVNASAPKLGLNATVSTDAWVDLVRDGLKRFGPRPELYIRPMYWAENGGASAVEPDAESTRYCLCLYETPMPPGNGFSVTLSPYRRPTLDTMPVDAKAGCLYPNNARAMRESRQRGFDNCLMCDMLGNVAELGSANIFLVKDGVVMTPIANGTFLNGVTRQRVIGLLREQGATVLETTLRYADFERADEIFSTGNYAKLEPATRIDGRSLKVGPIYKLARELYWAFAHS